MQLDIIYVAIESNISHVAKQQLCSQTSAMWLNNSYVAMQPNQTTAMQPNVSHMAKHQPCGDVVKYQRDIAIWLDGSDIAIWLIGSIKQATQLLYRYIADVWPHSCCLAIWLIFGYIAVVWLHRYIADIQLHSCCLATWLLFSHMADI